ncbi:MFS transporter, sugar porter (SP) family [Thalassotalea agarivorans]|uniref:MFS transporter, sugar porter (SP) family n=2 Tax=Thalassotalea agarivorans TaxID=349064 RepID=A0A1I0DYH6_THASX|nr:MFS transporter, sugar porter (SP) family [Thalassotalea agarivorans]
MKPVSHSVYYCAMVVAFGAFILGLDAALISGTIKFVSQEFALTDMQVGAMVSAPGLAVLFALMITGYICDRIGRKKTLIGISFIYIFSAIASTFAPNYETLIIARFIGGLAFTSLSVAAMYIGEIAPSKIRGKLVTIVQVSIVVGFSAAYFINYGVLLLSQSDMAWVSAIALDTQTWRWMLGVEIVPAIVWFALLFTIPKSPRWLIMKGQEEEAKDIIAQFDHDLSPEEEVAQVKTSLKVDPASNSFFASFKALFSTKLRKAVIVALTIAIVQQATGINAILFYAPTVFEQIGVGTDAAFLNAVVVGVVGVAFTIVAIFLIDKVGRRPLLMSGLILASVSLFICHIGFKQASYQLSAEQISEISQSHDISGIEHLADKTFDTDIAFKAALKQTMSEAELRAAESVLLQNAISIDVVVVMTGIMLFIVAFHYSLGPILWVLFSEIFPTGVRGVAIPVFAFISSMVSYFVQQFFPWLLNNIGAADVFMFYAISGVVGFVFLYKLLPETKHKTIEQIEAELVAS